MGELGMHRWYHDVDAAVQADATAIEAAMTGATFKKMYINYNKILGDSTLKPGAADDDLQIKARACVKTLSGAEKELVIQAGLRAPLFNLFKVELKKGLPVAGKDMLKVSKLVTGTLAATDDAPVKEGKETQPMYSVADAALRREMMSEMVTQLKNNQLPTAL